ncbi:hypothetical protein KKB18_12450, partial [bacterium]|nr:hypothetical protein [bacterium]
DCYIQSMTINNGKLARYFKNRNLVDTSLQDLSQEQNNRMLKDAFFLLSKGITSFDEVKKLFL